MHLNSSLRTVAGLISISLCLVACENSAMNSDSGPAGPDIGALDASPAQSDVITKEEPPFFVVDADAKGPLTLEELNIHIPAEIDKDLSNRQRKCFLARVDELAQEAGEPSDIDPDDFRYWGGNTSREDWVTLNREQQRTLLAQAIVTFGFQDCL